MEILVDRKWKRDAYTIGNLYVNGKRFSDGKNYCNTLEDTDRGLRQDMSTQTLLLMKKPGVTAIPTGKYKVTITYSSRFKRLMPLVNNVPAFSGIRIHAGNTAADTEGCLLVGRNTAKGVVSNSKYWFNLLYAAIDKALKRGESVNITYK